ncbi:MAG TPA: SDR family NAD(P)-dependent oxidoreductase [Pseudonocardia sp.]|jgi:NAD(P)-dependent dehydrogenase (short-subunit alcohol dehydrogenase family)
MTRLTDKVAVITGAGSGVGKAAARLFHAQGARLVVADITGAQNDVAADLDDQFVLPVQADVSNPADVEAMIATAVERFGRVDVLFNNAGIDGELGPIEQCSLENFEHVLAVNLRGVFLGIKAVLPIMKHQRSGSIINTASVAGIVGMPMLGAYCASKGGVVQLTKAVAGEVAKAGIRVNAICPGAIDTPLLRQLTATHPDLTKGAELMTPMGRRGQAEEIAQVALFLASDDSSFVTGAAYLVDGGLTSW